MTAAILLNTGSTSQTAVARQTGMMVTMNTQTGMIENKTDMRATMDLNTGQMMGK